MAVSVVDLGLRKFYVGTSGDAKPTDSTVSKFSEFIESDTGDTYIYSGAVWFLKTTSGVSAGTTALLASEEFIGHVGGNLADIAWNPTSAAAAYLAGDVFGGVRAMVGWSRVAGLGTKAMSMHIVNQTGVDLTMDLLFFNASPTAAPADNDPYAWNAADYVKNKAHVRVNASEYTTVAGIRLLSKSMEALGVVPNSVTTLYLIPVLVNAVTTTNANGLFFTFAPERD